jgi:lambda family phage portal protein
MSIFSWLFKPTNKSLVKKSPMSRLDRNAPVSQRHWKAATDTDSTLSHWGGANGIPINNLLSMHLDSLINRALFESKANPIVDGTINSHATDVVGPCGPALQMTSSDSKWNKIVETRWAEVANAIDGSGELSLPDFLKQGIRSLWTTGGILSQYVIDPEASTAIKHRLHTIPTQSLYSRRFNTTDTMLGITRNRLGRPTKYWILESGLDVASAYSFGINPIEVKASDIQHVYFKHDPQQWRGYPWLASSLQAIAELDEYSTAVLDAAKVAAMMSILFYSTRDDIETSDEVPDAFNPLRQSGVKVPPGWTPYVVNSNQPTQNHTEFRADKIRDIGRPVSMPLMSIQRDASNHNYSSARFDGQGYQRANESIQGFLERKSIAPFFDIFLQEGMLRGVIPYRPPEAVMNAATWIWPQPPSVDPVKESMAQRIQLENRTLSPQRACLVNNVDFETICEEWKLANDILKKHGLPEMMGPIPTDPVALAYAMSAEKKDEAK